MINFYIKPIECENDFEQPQDSDRDSSMINDDFTESARSELSTDEDQAPAASLLGNNDDLKEQIKALKQALKDERSAYNALALEKDVALRQSYAGMQPLLNENKTLNEKLVGVTD